MQLEEKTQLVTMTTNNDNSNSNSNNTYHIHINAFGKENIEHLRSEFIPSLLYYNTPEKAMFMLPNKVYNDPKYPENQTVQMKYDKTKFARVSDGCGGWLVMQKKKILDTICKINYERLKQSWAEHTHLKRYSTDRYFTLTQEFNLPWNDDGLLTEIGTVMMNKQRVLADIK